MATAKDKRAAAAQKKLDAARAAVALAEQEAIDAGVAVAAPAVLSPTKNSFTQTVWVGCKLPRGLMIQLCEETTVDRPTFGGGLKPTRMFMRVGEQIRLKGYAVPFGKLPNYPVIGDFGLTEIPRAFWEKWCEQNKGLDLLKNGLVFAHGEKDSTIAYANEHEGLKCGLEPLDPAGDPRADKVQSDNLTDVQADTERPSQRKPSMVA